jgi:hypothetical protein
MVSAQLDGQDIFEHGLVNALLERIVERMAPIATEVARHSPNPNELSLKLERDDGRREELYLRKADLRQLVAQLPANAQVLFPRLAFLTDRPPSHSPSVPPPPTRPL